MRFADEKRTVIDGPFVESKELIAGYWMWQVRSIDEAVEWLKRAPFDRGEEVEIRPVYEASDFGENLTAELRQQNGASRLRPKNEQIFRFSVSNRQLVIRRTHRAKGKGKAVNPFSPYRQRRQQCDS